MRITLTILLIISLFKPVCACKCDLSLLTTNEKIQSSNYIALIKVKNIISLGSHEYYKVIVDELILYKGKSTHEIIVSGANRFLDSNYWTSCDIDIHINEEWLIYSKDSTEEVHLRACSFSFQYKDKDGYRDIMDSFRIKILNETSEYFRKPVITYSIYEGLMKHYFPNGKLEFEMNYKKGLRQGESRYYYPSGLLNGMENYDHGKLNGIQKKYYADGALNFIKHYERGIEVDSSNFYAYDIFTRRYYIWMSFFRAKNGVILNSKSFILPAKFLLTLKPHYLWTETIYDTVSKNTSLMYYYPNGNIQSFYKYNKDKGEIGDEIYYSEEGYVIKILRSKKGEQAKVIYMDTSYHPTLK